VKQTSPKLESIIDLLCDGNCHSQSELQKTAQLNEHQTREVVAFLTEYGFAEVSNGNEKLKLTNDTRRLFSKST
jgi:DNA-binding IclR family transcriptional regulator